MLGLPPGRLSLRGDERESLPADPAPEPAGPSLARPLDPTGLLALQRAAGNRAVTRLLARQEVRPIDTGEDIDWEAFAAEAERERAERTAAARAPLDEALRRHDATMFLTRLRSMPDAQRLLLIDDASFMAEIRRVFSGPSRLRVSTLLRYGDQRPDHIVGLLSALSDADSARVADILRGHSELRDPAFLPGLREAVEVRFSGTPAAALLTRILTETSVGGRHGVSEGYTEAHYEQPPGLTTWEVQSFGGHTAYTLERTATELRVIVRIGLRETGGFGHLTPDVIARWRSGIEANWNNRFRFTNGTTALPVVFVPLFDRRNAGEHHIEVAPNPPPSGRADETHWHATMSASTAAHEFGHMLGNIDEYRLAAQASDIPASLGVDAATAAASTQAGLEAAEQAATGTSVQWAAPVHGQPGRTSSGIMGNQAGPAQGRNVLHILRFFNANVRQAGEAEFRIQVL